MLEYFVLDWRDFDLLAYPVALLSHTGSQRPDLALVRIPFFCHGIHEVFRLGPELGALPIAPQNGQRPMPFDKPRVDDECLLRK